MDLLGKLVHLKAIYSLPLLAGFGCGPDVSDGGPDATEVSTGPQTASSSSTSAPSATTAASSSSQGPDDDGTTGEDSTGGSPMYVWPEIELLGVLDGDPSLLEASSIAVTDDHIHVGARPGNYNTQRWTLDRTTGSEVQTGVVGGPIVATATRVYAAGDSDGTTGGMFSLVRTFHDGSGEEELMTSDEPLSMLAAASGEAFFVEYPANLVSGTLWRISDSSSMPAQVADLEGPPRLVAAYAQTAGAVYIADAVSSVLAVDLSDGAVATLASFPTLVTAIHATETALYVGTRESLHTGGPSGRNLGLIDDGDQVLSVSTNGENVFWVVDKRGDVESRLFAWLAPDPDPHQVPLDPDLGGKLQVVATQSELYLLTGASLTDVGRVWRLLLPSA